MIRKIAGNVFIYGFVNGLKSLVPFIMLPILTRYILPAEYGVLNLTDTCILFLSPLLLLNVNGAISVEYFKLSGEDFKAYVLNALLVTLISFLLFCVVLFVVKDTLSGLIGIPSSLVLLLPLFTFLRVISSIVLVIYQASEKPLKFGIFSIFQTLVDFGLSYVFVVILGKGYLGRIAGIYGAFAASSVVGLVVLYKMDIFSKPKTLKFTKNILDFGLNLIPHSIGGVILAMADRLFISHYLGTEEVGFYSVAYQAGAVMLLLGTSVNQAWGPTLFKLLKKKEDWKTIKELTLAVGVGFVIFAGVVFALSDLIFKYLIAEKYLRAQVFFGYLLLGFLFQSLYFLFTNYLFFYNKTRILAVITFGGAVLNLILNYVLIQKYGTVGVAYSTAITWCCYFIFVAVTAMKLQKRQYGL
ncbi:lipopolysaccharide biosynthesis protein [Bdellovibrio svalbardensis]|uniref:Oligosaccharide flippase family protein n=1 Tax=Bdellovibrio svalbardensis TaxID=2972972 RepID=A0ABT6DKL7_9BACT|nr:oligosaccharide flippase family protein [Bdellovibrio svalbardensis]MDG0817348.1 oligosaccharide flippase family protein [Bdellovibrio svalbardensis]